MYKAMPTMPVSDLRNNQPAILAQLDQTPVLLTQRGHSTAVLVNLQTWNRMVEELEHLRFIERMRQGAAEIERGEFVTSTVLASASKIKKHKKYLSMYRQLIFSASALHCLV